MIPQINIYTDGARQGKETVFGGWGVILEAPGMRKEFCGGVTPATNQQMELQAVIEGFQNIKVIGVDIKVFSDSAYVVNCFREKWYEKWERNGWIGSQKKPVENKAYWVQLLNFVKNHHSVTFFHLDGHINLNKPAEVEEYYRKFNQRNDVNFSLEEFVHIVENNNTCDKLAVQGVNDIRNKKE